jgi:hypothetical protein
MQELLDLIPFIMGSLALALIWKYKPRKDEQNAENDA